MDVALLQGFEIGQSGIEKTRRVWGLTESNGDSGYKTRIMNYSFVCFNGLRPKNYEQTVVLTEERNFALPHFVLTRRKIFQWFERLFNVPTLIVPGQGPFNKMYQLKGKDEIAVRALFTPQVRTALEQHAGLTIEGNDQQLLIFRERIVLDPVEFPAFRDEARRIAKVFCGN